MAQWEKLATATSSIESLLLLNANCLTPNLLVQPAPTFRKYAPESSLVEYFFIPKQNAKKTSQTRCETDRLCATHRPADVIYTLSAPY